MTPVLAVGLSTLRDVMTIVSGVVLALAAGLAFIVQRARYLRETDVQVEVDAVVSPLEVGPPQNLYLKVTLRNPTPHSVVIGQIRGILLVAGEKGDHNLTAGPMPVVTEPTSLGGIRLVRDAKIELQVHFAPEVQSRAGPSRFGRGSTAVGFVEFSYVALPDLLTGILLCKWHGRRRFSTSVHLEMVWRPRPDDAEQSTPTISGWRVD